MEVMAWSRMITVRKLVIIQASREHVCGMSHSLPLSAQVYHRLGGVLVTGTGIHSSSSALLAQCDPEGKTMWRREGQPPAQVVHNWASSEAVLVDMLLMFVGDRSSWCRSGNAPRTAVRPAKMLMPESA